MNYLHYVLVSGLLAMVFAFIKTNWINSQDEGSDRMKQIGASISDGAMAFLKAEKICIISHRSPDGDAVGSNLALRLQLEALGKEVVSACVDPLPQNSLFLKSADSFVQDFEYDRRRL